MTADAPAPVVTAVPTAKPRAISSQLSAKLTASLPKFAEKKAASERDAAPDQPRNGIVRLPRYDVREQRLPRFREREMLTPKGRVALAYKRHPGLKLDPLWFLKLNVGPALQMLEEEQRLERAAEMSEAMGFVRFADTLRAAESPATAPSP